jgi:beta-phosphoglucomutase-like phosphatase (HAD superfamily)
MTLQAVLWDMDGTLVDSEKVWAEVQIELLGSLGAIWTVEDCVGLIGSDLRDAVKVWMSRIPAGAITAEELAERMFRAVVDALKQDVEFRPGALELLQALRKEEVPCALVSASYRVMIDAVLSHLPPDLFDVIVAGDEVTNGKPHPEPYLIAAQHLGVGPEAVRRHRGFEHWRTSRYGGRRVRGRRTAMGDDPRRPAPTRRRLPRTPQPRVVAPLAPLKS